MWKKSEAARAEHPVCLPQARLQEGAIVVEVIGIRSGAEGGGAVALAPEAGPVAARVPHRPERDPLLRAARVEGRVDIDQIDAAAPKRAQDREIVRKHDPQHRAAPSQMVHGLGRAADAGPPAGRRWSRKQACAPRRRGAGLFGCRRHPLDAGLGQPVAAPLGFGQHVVAPAHAAGVSGADDDEEQAVLVAHIAEAPHHMGRTGRPRPRGRGRRSGCPRRRPRKSSSGP